MAAIVATFVAAIYCDSKFCANVFVFYAWMNLLVVCGRYAPKLKPDNLAMYRDPKGPHLPAWCDSIYYTGIVIALAGFGWWTTCIIWCIIAMLDFNMREESKKPAVSVSENVIIADRETTTK